MYVCMCVCMYVCMYVCVGVCMYVCVCVWCVLLHLPSLYLSTKNLAYRTSSSTLPDLRKRILSVVKLLSISRVSGILLTTTYMSAHASMRCFFGTNNHITQAPRVLGKTERHLGYKLVEPIIAKDFVVQETVAA